MTCPVGGTRLRVLRVFVRDFSLAFALPLLITSAHGVSFGAAGLLSALVFAVSAIGHLSSSLLLRVGVPIWANVAAAFGFFAPSGFAVYGNVLLPQGVLAAQSFQLFCL